MKQFVVGHEYRTVEGTKLTCTGVLDKRMTLFSDGYWRYSQDTTDSGYSVPMGRFGGSVKRADPLDIDMTWGFNTAPEHVQMGLFDFN